MGRAAVTGASLAGCLLAGGLLAGCIPDFDRFGTGGPAGDAGPGVDAGPGRDAGGGGEGTLLGDNADCAAIMTSVLFEEDFDGTPQFRLLSGSASYEGGEAVIAGGQEFVLLQSDSTFRNVVGCATVRMQRSTGGDQLDELHFGLRGLMHGVSLNLVGSDGDVKLVSVEPEANVLVARQPIDWPDGEHVQRMLVFLEGDRIYGEVQDTASGDVVTVFGTYGGVGDDVSANIEASELVSTAYVERVVLGTPTPTAAAVLRGE